MLINIFGRPGVGKSTMALELTSALKKMGKSAEYVPEYAKEMIYKAHEEPQMIERLLAHQLVILANQFQRLYDVSKCVDIVVTDAPLLLNLVYLRADDVIAHPDSPYELVVKDLHNSFNKKIDFFLKSTHRYEPKGRNQTYEESMQVEERLQKLSEDVGPFVEITTINEVWDKILKVEF